MIERPNPTEAERKCVNSGAQTQVTGHFLDTVRTCVTLSSTNGRFYIDMDDFAEFLWDNKFE